MLALLLLTLGVSETACPYPLHNSIVSKHSSLKHARRWITYGSPKLPWPKDRDSPIHTIPYCYTDRDSWLNLHGLVESALAMWFDKLGAPGQNNGHAVRIVEPTGPGFDAEPYCFLKDVEDVWNPLFDSSTLAIEEIYDTAVEDKTAGAKATPGYKPGNDPQRHTLEIDLGNNNDPEGYIYMITHEFGHVLGLEHEHQRDDRDKYLHFECQNLEGYDEAVEEIEAQMEVEGQERDKIQVVCVDDEKAMKYDFDAAAEFTKTVSWQGVKTEVMKGPFDIDSIMLYDSHAFMSLATKNRNNILDLPLVKWKNPDQFPAPTERTLDNCEPIPPRTAVSDGDREGVKQIYPW